MNCERFISLSNEEKIQLIGKLVHSVQNDNACFNWALFIIEYAENKGVLNGVKINPLQELGKPPITE